MSLFLIRQALDRGIDVHSMATTIPTFKTAQVAQYLHHTRVSLSAFPILFEHYNKERPLRWKTHYREQKALHGICIRIKGNKQAKKEDVVVAYGAGQLGSTMKGKRAAPVKNMRYGQTPAISYSVQPYCNALFEFTQKGRQPHNSSRHRGTRVYMVLR
ncbi:hypothetical protein V1505DRAFT_167637 [Lipomyces doorenjongii]